jgi:hypothetical protein
MFTPVDLMFPEREKGYHSSPPSRNDIKIFTVGLLKEIRSTQAGVNGVPSGASLRTDVRVRYDLPFALDTTRASVQAVVLMLTRMEQVET